ncbi:MAG: response regulator [Candidatus Omnitrophota bacterium]
MLKKILVVDDEADLLMVTMFRLKHMGYEIFGATDGQEALDAVRKKSPDLIIMDVFLPGMNGDEVAKILKKDKKTKRIPVILISADIRSLQEKAAACGAEGYLTKPFHSSELVDLVQKHIG